MYEDAWALKSRDQLEIDMQNNLYGKIILKRKPNISSLTNDEVRASENFGIDEYL